VAAGQLIMLPDTQGRRRTALAAVVAASGMFDVPPLVMVVGLVGGLPIGWVGLRLLYGDRTGGDVAASASAGAVAFGMVYAAAHVLLGHGVVSSTGAHLIVTALGGFAWMPAAATVSGMRLGRRRSISRRGAVRRELAGWTIHAALLAIGSLFAVALPLLGWSALAIAGIPYGFIHLSMTRMELARRTFSSTIDVLGRIPEAGGHVADGRSRGVAQLAVGIAAEMGLSRARLDVVEHAARLHGLGAIVLNDPAIASSQYSSRDLAQWGAAIVGEASSLKDVATVIAAHRDPYRHDGEAASDAVPVESRVLRVAVAFTDALEESSSVGDALDTLHRGMTYDYQPEGVSALRRHLARRGLTVG
jgi:hypothetical protein